MQPERDPIKALQQAMISGGMELFQLVPGFVRGIIEDEAWKGRADAEGRPFSSFKAFSEAPMWEGLGTPLHRLRDFCHKFPDVVRLIDVSVPEVGEVGRPAKDEEKGYDVTISRGNSTDYLAARLKRDRPELLEEVASGRRTVRDAAREAGIVKPPNAYKQLCAAWRRASEEERAEFEDYIAAWRRRDAA